MHGSFPSFSAVSSRKAKQKITTASRSATRLPTSRERPYRLLPWSTAGSTAHRFRASAWASRRCKAVKARGTYDERVRRLAVRPGLDDGCLLLALCARRTRRGGGLGLPTRRARIVPVFLLDAYPDPVFPADVQLRVLGLREEFFHGRARLVAAFGGEPEIGAAVVVTVAAAVMSEDFDARVCDEVRERTRSSSLAGDLAARACRRRTRPRLGDSSRGKRTLLGGSLALELLTDDAFGALRLDFANERLANVWPEDDQAKLSCRPMDQKSVSPPLRRVS